jgi:hypothetical protein
VRLVVVLPLALLLLRGCGDAGGGPRPYSVAQTRAAFARHGIRLTRLPPMLQPDRDRTELGSDGPSLEVTVYSSVAAAAHGTFFLLGEGKPHSEVRRNVLVAWLGREGPRVAAALRDLR